MKVLLTGGAGYLGSVVTRELLVHGHEVRVLDCLLYGEKGLSELWTNDRFQFSRGDIRSSESIEAALEGMGAVVHLAALVGDPACARRPDLARRTNQEASLRLFEQSHRRGIHRFLFASTCSNYGRMSNPTEHLTEESPLQPISLYAKTKVAVEQALLGSGTSNGTSVTVLRFATLYGLSPRMRFDLTVNEFTMELVTQRKLTIHGEQFWRPYLHVTDAARAIRLVLESPREKVGGEAFNAGDSRQNYQKGQLVELICSQIGGLLQIDRVAQGDDPRDYRVSFEKIRQRLGFQVTRSVEDGVREIMEAISQGVLTDLENPLYRN